MKQKGGIDMVYENFNHWVWVYGVEPNKGTDSLGQFVDLVKFTETGTPFYDPVYDPNKPRDGKEYWPSKYYVSGQEISTYLPWWSGKRWAKGDPSTGKLISSTELVWKWWAHDYVWGGTAKPFATTRYYDGSP